MKPVSFREQNIVYCSQPGEEDEVGDLPAYLGDDQVISCWSVGPLERLLLLFTGRLWFGVKGNAQPPVWLCVKRPFTRQK